MTWLDQCFGAERLRAVFGADDLRPTGWRIVDLRAERNALSAVVDLDQYPRSAPKKWDAQGADTVLVTLSFDSRERLELSGRVAPDDRVALEAGDGDPGDRRVGLMGEHLSVVAVRSLGVSLLKVEGVRRSDRVGPADGSLTPVAGAWLPGVGGGSEVVEAFAPGVVPDQPGALRTVEIAPPRSVAVLTYNLDRYPDVPPTNWHPDANTVTVDIRFDGVQSVHGHLDTGMPWEMAATTDWSDPSDGVEATVRGDAVDLRVAAASATVSHVAAYLHADS